MITEQPDFDLSKLGNLFRKREDWTKEETLKELQYWRENTDFLILISETTEGIDGYLIGYRNRHSLWIYDVWRKSGSDLAISRKAFEMTKDWARKRGMTSITGETKRNEMKAVKRYGFVEDSVVIKCLL